MLPGIVTRWPLKKVFEKGRGQGHVTPYIFWTINANSSKTTKGPNFKFGAPAPKESPHMTPEGDDL